MHNMQKNGDTDGNDNMIGEAGKPSRFCFPWQRRKTTSQHKFSGRRSHLARKDLNEPKSLDKID